MGHEGDGGGERTLLDEVLSRHAVEKEASGVVYFCAEWTAPVDALVLPYIASNLTEDERLVVVQRDEYARTSNARETSIVCDASEFRELCRQVGVKRLPMCISLGQTPTGIEQLVEQVNTSPSLHDWLPVASEYPSLEKDTPALVELRAQATTNFEGGDFIAGAVGFTRALVHCPTCPKSNFNMSVVLQMMDELYFAVDHMLRVVDESDQDAVAHTVLRTVLFPAEPQLVLEGYEAILNKHEDHFRAQHSLATLRGEAKTAAPAYVRQVFDHLAETFEEKLVTHLEYRIPWQIVDALQRSSALPALQANSDSQAPFAVVDLGCGTGLCGRLLRPFVTHVAGIDLSPLMIEKTRETGYYDELMTADIIPFLSSKPDESVDLVVSADVWIYVGALDEIFPVVVQKLRKQGWFAFSTELLAERDGFQLASSGRFKHSDAYISMLAERHGFRICIQDAVTVRKESGEPIPGRVFVLQRHG